MVGVERPVAGPHASCDELRVPPPRNVPGDFTAVGENSSCDLVRVAAPPPTRFEREDALFACPVVRDLEGKERVNQPPVRTSKTRIWNEI